LNYLYLIAFIFLPLCFLIQLYFIVFVQGRLRSFKADLPGSEIQHPVSIIICARNEQKNLAENLSAVLEQDYPDFEVVVVNDCSSDESKYILEDFSKHYPFLKVVTIAEHERFRHGKKFAVTLGIKASKNEYLVFTDADCKPASKNWLRTIQENFTEGKEIVLGYSPYQIRPGIVNKLICLETFYTAINYFSFYLAGNPYMGVGRNLAYTKSLFFKGKGFASHMHVLSGDDDLFVNQHAYSENTAIEIRLDSHVWTEPKTTLSAFVTQKLRHAGASKLYKGSHKRMLSLQAGSGILFYAFFILLILTGKNLPWIFAVYFVRLIVQAIVYYPLFKKLNYRDLSWWFPIMDLIYYFYLLALYLITQFKKEVKWR
jgi:biofilm PGA synthesis N-glycosyltransferase PgaC